MYLVYDGNCHLCRRTVASFRVFDIFARVNYVNAFDSPALENAGLDGLDSAGLMRDIHVVVGANTWRGFVAYREWMKRVPLFWLAVPLMYLWPATHLGNRFYRHVADSRVCTIVETSPAHVSQRKPIFAIGLVGFLLTFMAVLSALGKLQSWPMAGYPTFEDIDSPSVRLLTIVAQDEDGKTSEIRPIEDRNLTEMTPERLMGLQNHLLSISDQSERTRRLEVFWSVCRREDPSLRRLIVKRFYGDTVSTLPEDRNRGPIKRELIAEGSTVARQPSTAGLWRRVPGDEAK